MTSLNVLTCYICLLFPDCHLTVLCSYIDFCCFSFSLLNLVTIVFWASFHFLCLPPIIALYWLNSVFLGSRDVFDYNLVLIVGSHQLQFPSLLFLQVAVQSYCCSGLRIWAFSYFSNAKKFNWMPEIEKREKKISYTLRSVSGRPFTWVTLQITWCFLKFIKVQFYGF